ncbi:MAG: L,D-transpeptidase [Candidatus Gracilibacteria bacterium]|nr:L,D-transpeptidase [Candidatus Gracilibacteria bacterium]MDD2908267.1 L,D-transpeptidase [Candidatus Gracilibacteria bacterium]
MDRREFLKICSLAVIGAALPKTVLGDTKAIIKQKFEKALSGNEEMEIEKNEVFTKKISEMKGTPLEMKGIAAKNSLSQFLGLNQYELIFKKYNPHLTKYKKNGKINDNKNSYINDELEIPRIYDELTKYFPDNLDELIIQNPELKNKIGNDSNFLYLTKVGNGKFALSYYKDSELFLATYVSPGKISKIHKKRTKDKITGELKTITIPGGENSPNGIYRITKSEYLKYKKSRQFELSPMPYAIHIYKGIFLHHGQDVNGNKKSHGCIRVPGFYQEELYKHITSGTKIIISGTNEKN